MAASQFKSQGTYGCVYAPAFECASPDPVPRDRRVSKIFKPNLAAPDDYYREYSKEHDLMAKLNGLLSAIDPDEDYFIYKYHVCKVKKARTYPHIISSCPAFKSDHAKDYFYALNYTKGEYDLNTLLQGAAHFTEYDFKVLLVQLKNIIQGLALLHKNGVYHLDVKSANIILQDDLCKLIDFGLTRNTTTKSDLFLATYAYWPVETVLLAKQPAADLNRAVWTFENEPYIRRLRTAFPFALPDLTQVSTRSLKHLFMGVDVWGFGLLLFEVYEKIPSRMQVKARLKPLIAEFLVSPRMTSGAALKRYTNFMRQFLPSPIQALEGKMSKVSRARYTQQEAAYKSAYRASITQASRRGITRNFAIERALKILHNVSPDRRWSWEPRGRQPDNLWKWCQYAKVKVENLPDVLPVLSDQYCIQTLEIKVDSIISNLEHITLILLKDGGFILIRKIDTLYLFVGMNFQLEFTLRVLLTELQKPDLLSNIKDIYALSPAKPKKRPCDDAGACQGAPPAKRSSVWMKR
jgi:serine/threonine protein kinase